MSKRWVEVRVSETDALNYSETLLRTMGLLHRLMGLTQGRERLAAERSYLELREQLDLWDRGLVDAEPALPLDTWQRPVLPSYGTSMSKER